MSVTALPKTTTRLKLSTSRKVTHRAIPKKSGGHTVTANAFSLPPIDSCPGATPACSAVCYAERDAKQYPTVRALHHHNFDRLKEARGEAKMAELLIEVVERFLVEHKRVSDDKPTFRIHESGDFHNRTYAKAWRRCVKAFPQVSFWAYTRSWHGQVDVTDILSDIDNLTMYVSVDSDSEATYAKLKPILDARGAKLAYMGAADTIREDSTEAAGRKIPLCPVLTKRVPLVTKEGRGGCQACQLCISGVQPVAFPIHR